MSDNGGPAFPVWERGYRCHGFWIGTKRLGVVGYGPGKGAAKAGGYTWEYGPPSADGQPSRRYRKGWAIDLATAKRRVAKAHRDIQWDGN